MSDSDLRGKWKPNKKRTHYTKDLTVGMVYQGPNNILGVLIGFQGEDAVLRLKDNTTQLFDKKTLKIVVSY
jgi:hypothetical protein